MDSKPKSFEEILDRSRILTSEERAARKRELLEQSDEEYRIQLRQRKIEQCRRISEIGPRFAERTFESFEVADGNAEALIVAKDVASDPTLGAYVWGVYTGQGKSHLAGAIVNSSIASGTPAVFITDERLMRKIRDTYTPRGHVKDGELDIIDRLVHVPVLVLDDLGTEPFTAHAAAKFYALINGRFEEKLPLIVTSNVSLADLGVQWAKSGVEQHLSNKLIGRLRDMCTFKVQVTEKPYRKAPAA
jgi:DNA replication protein DnaC